MVQRLWTYFILPINSEGKQWNTKLRARAAFLTRNSRLWGSMGWDIYSIEDNTWHLESLRSIQGLSPAGHRGSTKPQGEWIFSCKAFQQEVEGCRLAKAFMLRGVLENIWGGGQLTERASSLKATIRQRMSCTQPWWVFSPLLCGTPPAWELSDLGPEGAPWVCGVT